MGSSYDVHPTGTLLFGFYSQEILFYQLFAFSPQTLGASIGIFFLSKCTSWRVSVSVRVGLQYRGKRDQARRRRREGL
jgi:hypothetical protein